MARTLAFGNHPSGGRGRRLDNLLMFGTTLLLGSWYGLLLVLILVGMIAGRAVLEECTLREELQGYDSYMAQVKYRLIPYIW
jgi:protein-S-isoprenylcysteine O-methyltransferase Ste14